MTRRCLWGLMGASLSVLLGACGGSMSSGATTTVADARQRPEPDDRAALREVERNIGQLGLGTPSGSESPERRREAVPEPEPASNSRPMAAESASAVSLDFDDDDFYGDFAQPDGATTTPVSDQMASAPTQADPTAPDVQTDAVDLQGPLLVYTAAFVLGVYEVEQTQDAIVERVESLGGYLQRRTESELLLRVPVENFGSALEGVESAGDVLARRVEAADVGEEFRDVAIRIRNGEAMRERLEGLLQRAESVTAALEIERELQRITQELEQLKGRQRYLRDRIQLSTLSVSFQALADEPAERGPEGFELPFQWLREIGLTNLMRLR